MRKKRKEKKNRKVWAIKLRRTMFWPRTPPPPVYTTYPFLSIRHNKRQPRGEKKRERGVTRAFKNNRTQTVCEHSSTYTNRERAPIHHRYPHQHTFFFLTKIKTTYMDRYSRGRPSKRPILSSTVEWPPLASPGGNVLLASSSAVLMSVALESSLKPPHLVLSLLLLLLLRRSPPRWVTPPLTTRRTPYAQGARETRAATSERLPPGGRERGCCTFPSAARHPVFGTLRRKTMLTFLPYGTIPYHTILHRATRYCIVYIYHTTSERYHNAAYRTVLYPTDHTPFASSLASIYSPWYRAYGIKSETKTPSLASSLSQGKRRPA